ncbi:hypothetical protein ACK39D_05375 [Aeromonas veronii]
MELIRNEFKSWFSKQTGMEAKFDVYNTAFVTKPPKTSGEKICNTSCMGMWEAWQASREAELQRGQLLYADLVQRMTEMTIQHDDLLEMQNDHHRLVRELDVLLNGVDGAAPQASLCDLVAQLKAKGGAA